MGEGLERIWEKMGEQMEEESCESERRRLFLEHRDESIILDYSLQYLSLRYNGNVFGIPS